jgi:nucleotide-binding universal stress UspA family protein
MKILLAVDGSACSESAIEQVAEKLLPEGSEIKILSAIEPIVAAGGPVVLADSYYQQMEDIADSRANQAVVKAEERLRSSAKKGVTITTQVAKGFPKEVIIDEADRWNADLIVVGSHGYHGLTRFLLGSVSQAVAGHANCSVEIVRCRVHKGEDKAKT